VSDALERDSLLAAAREFEQLVDGLEGPSSNAVCLCAQMSKHIPRVSPSEAASYARIESRMSL
jgi:hypothetical protein